MSDVCENIIPQLQIDYAVLVVHAHESRLSLNEDNAGIGYSKIYTALLRETGKSIVNIGMIVLATYPYLLGMNCKEFLVKVIMNVRHRVSRGSLDIKGICACSVVPYSHLILPATGKKREE